MLIYFTFKLLLNVFWLKIFKSETHMKTWLHRRKKNDHIINTFFLKQGTVGFENQINKCLELAEYLYTKIKNREEFEMVFEGEVSFLSFDLCERTKSVWNFKDSLHTSPSYSSKPCKTAPIFWRTTWLLASEQFFGQVHMVLCHKCQISLVFCRGLQFRAWRLP